MSDINQVGQNLREHLRSNKLAEAWAAASWLLSVTNGSQADFLTIVDQLLADNQPAYPIALAKKAFLADPFNDGFFVWLETAKLPYEFRDFLSKYATNSRTHFQRVLSAVDEGGPLTFVDLGSSAADHFQIPNWLASHTHVVSLDGLSVPTSSDTKGKRTSLKSIVAGKSGPAIFHEKYWLAASSLLPDAPQVVADFGMEQFAQVKTAHSVTTKTLRELLQENGIGRIDALKTDLEGIDLDVVKSIEDLLPTLSFLRMELAFLPRYQGEPCFHEAHQYLSDRGFSLLGLKQEFWRYKTEHRDYSSKGRMVWGDFEYLASRTLESDPEESVRYLLLAFLCGYGNYAEHLIETCMRESRPDLSQSLKFVIFGEIALVQPQHVDSHFPHLGTS